MRPATPFEVAEINNTYQSIIGYLVAKAPNHELRIDADDYEKQMDLHKSLRIRVGMDYDGAVVSLQPNDPSYVPGVVYIEE